MHVNVFAKKKKNMLSVRTFRYLNTVFFFFLITYEYSVLVSTILYFKLN